VIGNAAMLCPRHHNDVHLGGWTIRGHPDHQLRFHPPPRPFDDPDPPGHDPPRGASEPADLPAAQLPLA
jgi:hypothetical protein